jgi:hypothetical protein
MSTVSLDIIKSKPGMYILVSLPGTLAFIEVEPGGVIHQLKPDTMKRDGILRPDGWNLKALSACHGPYTIAT